MIIWKKYTKIINFSLLKHVYVNSVKVKFQIFIAQ